MARMARRMKQSDLRQALNCDQTTISTIETGRRDPSLEMLRAITAALEIPLSLVFAMSEEHSDDYTAGQWGRWSLAALVKASASPDIAPSATDE